jgi:hypothetical protein
MWALHRTRKLKKKNERRVEDNFLLNKAKVKMFAVSQDTEDFLCRWWNKDIEALFFVLSF